MKAILLLFHTHKLASGEEDSKLIGVYATPADATAAQQRASAKPGFKEHTNGFTIDAYEIGKGHWAKGFQTISAD